MRATSIPEFETITLRFTRQIYYADEHIFQLEVRSSPYPLSGGAFQANSAAQIEQFQGLFAQRLALNQFFNRFIVTAPENAAGDLTELGQALYKLLPESFRAAFPGVIQHIFEQGKGARLILETRADDKAHILLSLPWEILFFTSTGAFPGRSPRVLIERRLLDALRRSAASFHTPPDILHIIAHSTLAPLEYAIDENLQQVERETIQQAVGGNFYRQVEAPGSVEQLLAVLRQHPYHALHFLGHGEIRGSGPEARGYLRFVAATGESQWVYGEQLQHLLEFAPTLQLVTLNTCHGGANVARSVALELIYNGLPYVVAFQGDILQESTQHFIAAFYQELQQGRPIAYAVAVGRAAIAIHLPHTLDWCLPVLYTNVGLPEPPTITQSAEQLWRWMSAPFASRWLGALNLGMGSLFSLLSLLLLLSGQTIRVDFPASLNWIAGIQALLPVALSLAAARTWRTLIPPDWSANNTQMLYARMLASGAIGLAISMLYVWNILLFCISVGLWNLLNTWAQVLLLVSIFGPGLAFGGLFSYSQILGHTRALLSNAQIAPPVWDWKEGFLIAGGYVILLLPWLGLKLALQYLPLPGCTLIVGGLLLALGYALWREKR